ncbi:MAG: NUDIX domain-containing protein [Micromonosporaceae bacterium]|nr:NUDIX domain-containing protein [Micromonosporaceae bacterium]
MPKRDYLDDPNAPAPNSLVVAVGAVVRNADGAILLIKRGDNGLWALPGGAQDLGESTTDAVVREVREETGLQGRVAGLVGIYSNPGHVIAYDDGEVRQEFSVVFRVDAMGGEVRPSTESVNVEWVTPDRVPDLDIHPSMRLRIEHGLADLPTPYLC